MSDSDVEILNLEPDLQVESLGDDLREWATRHHITHRSLNELLHILRGQATPQTIDSPSVMGNMFAIACNQSNCKCNFFYTQD